MINERELTIGNWVNYEGKPVKVLFIRTNVSSFERKENENSFCVMRSGNAIADAPDFSNFSPIELTGSILQKAGFAKHSLAGYTEHFTYSKYIGGEVIRITALYDFDFSMLLHGTARRVTYLHDLQNKIFAVTGQELEIELKIEQ